MRYTLRAFQPPYLEVPPGVRSGRRRVRSRSIHEGAIRLHYRVIDLEATFQEAVQCLLINFLAGCADLLRQVMNAHMILLQVYLQRGLYPLSLPGCHGNASLKFVVSAKPKIAVRRLRGIIFRRCHETC